MSTYPPNQTIPKKGSDGYLWNWLGSSLKKFAAALSPYLSGGDSGVKVYRALLVPGADPNTDNPVATVLENTIGPIQWIKGGGPGYYSSDIMFPDRFKVFISMSGNYSDEGYGTIREVNGEVVYNDNKLWFATWDYTGNLSNNWGSNDTPIFIEIRVYP